MKTVKDLLESRRQEVLAKLKPLNEQETEIKKKLRDLEEELAQIDRAIQAIHMVNGLPKKAAKTALSDEKPTIKEAVLEILAEKPDGLAALDILRLINARFSLGIVRSSLSPQLSRLKDEEKIKNEGIVWSLTQKKKSGSDV